LKVEGRLVSGQLPPVGGAREVDASQLDCIFLSLEWTFAALF
jgi:hypothetical protein